LPIVAFVSRATVGVGNQPRRRYRHRVFQAPRRGRKSADVWRQNASRAEHVGQP